MNRDKLSERKLRNGANNLAKQAKNGMGWVITSDDQLWDYLIKHCKDRVATILDSIAPVYKDVVFVYSPWEDGEMAPDTTVVQPYDIVIGLCARKRMKVFDKLNNGKGEK